MDNLLQEVRKANAGMSSTAGIAFQKFKPSLGEVRGPAPLAQAAAIAWMLDNEAEMTIFPRVSVEQQSGEYREWPRNVLHSVKAQKMAVGDIAKEIYDAPEFKTYSTEMFGLQAPVFDKVIANQNAQVDYVQRAGVNLAQAMERVMIDAFIDVAMKPEPWTYKVAGNASVATTQSPDPASGTAANRNFRLWSDFGADSQGVPNSNPIRDVRACRLEIWRRTGYKPNVLWITPDVEDVLIQHPHLIDRVNRGQTSGAAQPTLEQIAGLFGIPIKVMGSIGRDSEEAQSDFLVTKEALMAYLPENAVMDEPSAGYMFSWSMGMSGNEYGISMDQYRDEARQCTHYRGQTSFDFQIVAADLGCHFNNVIA